MTQPHTLPDIHLFDKAECPFCWKVRIALNLKGLAFTETVVDTENKPDSLLKLSPEGKVPVLVSGKTVVADSPRIMEWLEAEATHPLLCADPDALKVEHYSDKVIGPAIRDHIFMIREAKGGATDMAVTTRCQNAWHQCMEYLEEICIGNPWFLGGCPTVADCALAARFALANHYGLTGLEQRPRLQAWYGHVRQAAAFLQSTPAHISAQAELGN